MFHQLHKLKVSYNKLSQIKYNLYRKNSSKSFFRQGPISWASFTLCVLVGSGALITFQVQKDKKLASMNSKVETTGKAG